LKLELPVLKRLIYQRLHGSQEKDRVKIGSRNHQPVAAVPIQDGRPAQWCTSFRQFYNGEYLHRQKINPADWLRISKPMNINLNLVKWSSVQVSLKLIAAGC
jgi:hypothetical protein